MSACPRVCWFVLLLNLNARARTSAITRSRERSGARVRSLRVFIAAVVVVGSGAVAVEVERQRGATPQRVWWWLLCRSYTRRRRATTTRRSIFFMLRLCSALSSSLSLCLSRSLWEHGAWSAYTTLLPACACLLAPGSDSIILRDQDMGSECSRAQHRTERRRCRTVHTVVVVVVIVVWMECCGVCTFFLASTPVSVVRSYALVYSIPYIHGASILLLHFLCSGRIVSLCTSSTKLYDVAPCVQSNMYASGIFM